MSGEYYYWDRDTDVLTKAKYNILKDPKELWEPEFRELSDNWEKNKRVEETLVRGFYISTVFLSFDHGWFGISPILFETMIFDHSLGRANYNPDFQNRYSTSTEARADHKRIADLSRRLLLKSPQISRKNYRKVMGKI